MKAVFKNMVGGFQGTVDDIIFYYSRRMGRTYARKRPVYVECPQHINAAEVMRNIRKWTPSEAYKDDFRDYLILYNQLYENKWHPVYAWNNLYIKLLYAMVRAIPGIDLKTLTRQQIYDDSLPCISVKVAVQAGLLPIVKGYQHFDHQL